MRYARSVGACCGRLTNEATNNVVRHKGEYQPMATTPPDQHAPERQRAVLRWLLAADPSIRWQVLRELTAPDERVAEAIDVVASKRDGAVDRQKARARLVSRPCPWLRSSIIGPLLAPGSRRQ